MTKLSKEKKPIRFKNFKINEKIKYFLIRRLMIFQNLVNKKKFFKKVLNQIRFLILIKFYLKLLMKFGFWQVISLQIIIIIQKE